jgi:hypothetical protein
MSKIQLRWPLSLPHSSQLSARLKQESHVWMHALTLNSAALIERLVSKSVGHLHWVYGNQQHPLDVCPPYSLDAGVVLLPSNILHKSISPKERWTRITKPDHSNMRNIVLYLDPFPIDSLLYTPKGPLHASPSSTPSHHNHNPLELAMRHANRLLNTNDKRCYSLFRQPV